MLRFLAGVGSTLLLVTAGLFLWQSRAGNELRVPPAPGQTNYLTPLALPPEASAKAKEEKRFARADKNKDGRITRAELMQPRQKAFAKLDKNGDGRLSFDEWAVATSDKFAGADADRSGWLSPAEYATTAPKPAPKKSCAC
jgi:hypothetical protein